MVVPGERDTRAKNNSRRDPKASSRSNKGSKKGQGSDRAAEVAAFERLVSSFKISLNAQNLSVRTVGTYSDSVRDLQRYLVEQGMPLDPTAISREHLEGFISYILSSVSPKTGRPYKPATANNRYRGLQVFFKWLIEMGEIRESPMRNMKPPRIPEAPPPVLSEEQVRRMLKESEGKSFEERRDMAILRMFIDTGMRCSELARLKLEDIDWEMQVAHVLGKGRKARACPFGKKTLKALDLYVNWARSKHKEASAPALWLGHEGIMTPSGIYQVVRDRAQAAGVKCYPHLLRHLAAHRYLSAGGRRRTL